MDIGTPAAQDMVTITMPITGEAYPGNTLYLSFNGEEFARCVNIITHSSMCGDVCPGEIQPRKHFRLWSLEADNTFGLLYLGDPERDPRVVFRAYHSFPAPPGAPGPVRYLVVACLGDLDAHRAANPGFPKVTPAQLYAKVRRSEGGIDNVGTWAEDVRAAWVDHDLYRLNWGRDPLELVTVETLGATLPSWPPDTVPQFTDVCTVCLPENSLEGDYDERSWRDVIVPVPHEYIPDPFFARESLYNHTWVDVHSAIQRTFLRWDDFSVFDCHWNTSDSQPPSERSQEGRFIVFSDGYGPGSLTHAYRTGFDALVRKQTMPDGSAQFRLGDPSAAAVRRCAVTGTNLREAVQYDNGEEVQVLTVDRDRPLRTSDLNAVHIKLVHAGKLLGSHGPLLSEPRTLWIEAVVRGTQARQALRDALAGLAERRVERRAGPKS